MKTTFNSLKETLQSVTLSADDDKFLILGDFQAHKGFSAIPLRPLTILLGPNSVGKTSIIRALKCLSDLYHKGVEDAYAGLGGSSTIGISLMVTARQLEVAHAEWVDNDYISKNVQHGLSISQFDHNPENFGIRSFRERLTLIFEFKESQVNASQIGGMFEGFSLVATVLIGVEPFLQFKAEWQDDYFCETADARWSISESGAKKYLSRKDGKKMATPYLHSLFEGVNGRGANFLEGVIETSWGSLIERSYDSKQVNNKSMVIHLKEIPRSYKTWWKLGPPRVGNPASWLVDLVELEWDFGEEAINLYYLIAQFFSAPLQEYLFQVPTTGNRPIRETAPALTFPIIDGELQKPESADNYLFGLACCWFEKLKSQQPNCRDTTKEESHHDKQNSKLSLDRYKRIKSVLKDRSFFGCQLDFGIAYTRVRSEEFLMGIDPAEFNRYRWSREEGKVELRLFVDGAQRNFDEIGSGVAQALPVILAALSGGPQSVQQPELHLHPRLHGKVADLVVDGVSDRMGVILIETHSEHLILRVLRRIAESDFHPGKKKGISNKDIAIIFMEPSKKGTISHVIQVGRDGSFLDPWPSGFFEERLDDLAVLFSAASANDTFC